MRIISGSAKGRKLRQFKGQNIRPTTDRVREALFSSLQSRLGTFSGLKVLDLFAGTGALSLEALSRGAAYAVLVDQSPNSVAVMAENVKSCGMQDRTRLFRTSAGTFVNQNQAAKDAPFDLIFLDPPYSRNLITPTLNGIVKNKLLSGCGIICVEAARKDPVPSEVPGLIQLDRREYGSTAVSFFSLSKPGEDQP